MPHGSQPRSSAARVTARTTAFRPGASPPPVLIASLRIELLMAGERNKQVEDRRKNGLSGLLRDRAERQRDAGADDQRGAYRLDQARPLAEDQRAKGVRQHDAEVAARPERRRLLERISLRHRELSEPAQHPRPDE